MRLMQLILAREGLGEHPGEDAFAPEDLPVLAHLGGKLEGRTVKQKNPHQPYSLAWAAWVIARAWAAGAATPASTSQAPLPCMKAW